MSRLIEYFKFESNDLAKPSVLVLILANLAPLYGVLFWGWQVFPILLVFWLENVIIGIMNVGKMLLLSPSDSRQWGAKFFFIPFFCVHYGIFTTVHGVFIFALFGDSPEGGGMFGIGDSVSHVIDDYSLGLAVLALLISHSVSFGLNYLGKGENKRGSLSGLLFQPYGRVIVMHITILAGAFLLTMYGTPVVGLAVLVFLKIVVDLIAHLLQHKTRNTPVKAA